MQDIHCVSLYTCMKPGLFTYADRRAGLPVVSVIHLYTGDFVVPLELVSWVALKGHGIPRLTSVSTTTAVHWHAGVSAGRSYRAWTERGETERGQKWHREKEERMEDEGEAHYGTYLRTE